MDFIIFSDAGFNFKQVRHAQASKGLIACFAICAELNIRNCLPKAEGISRDDPNYKLASREKKHRIMLKLEQWFGFRFNKKHYRPVR